MLAYFRLALAMAFASLSFSPMAAWSVDAASAEQLIKDNKCNKCHTNDRKKDGPAYRDVAAKFKAEPDAQEKILHHLTAGEMVKLPDGHQEKHKKIKTPDDAALKNVAQYILSLEGGTKY
jgi:cytochrome c